MTKPPTKTVKVRGVAIGISEEGVYSFQIGNAVFCFNSELMDMVEEISGNLPCQFVLLSDLLDVKSVEAIAVDGNHYTKTDIRIMLRDLMKARSSNIVPFRKP